MKQMGASKTLSFLRTDRSELFAGSALAAGAPLARYIHNLDYDNDREAVFFCVRGPRSPWSLARTTSSGSRSWRRLSCRCP